jgi:hypothetical protein
MDLNYLNKFKMILVGRLINYFKYHQSKFEILSEDVPQKGVKKLNKILYKDGKAIHNYDLNIYTKELVKNYNDKQQIVKMLLEKADINLKQINSKLKLTQEVKEILGCKEDIINKYINKKIPNSTEFILKKLEEVIFNKSDFYFKWLVNTLTNGTDDFLKHNKINVNYKVLQYLLNNSMVYNNTKTFGAVYQTIQHISKQTNLSRLTVTGTLRKLEFIGILDGIVGDNIERHTEVYKYFSKVDSKHIKEFQQQNYRGDKYINNGYFIFPLINFENLLHCTPDEDIKKIFKICVSELIYDLNKEISQEILNMVADDKEEFIQFIENKPIENKVPEYTVSLDRYKKYIKINSIIDRPEIKDNFIDFYEERKYSSYKINNIVEEGYLIGKWLQDNLKMVYTQITEKPIKKLNNKIFNFLDQNKNNVIQKEDIIFNQRFTGLYNGDDYYNNLRSLFKYMINKQQLGIFETIKYNSSLYDINVFKIFKDKDLQLKILTNQNKNKLQIHNWYYISNKLLKFKTKTKFGLYDIISELYFKQIDKIQYIKDLYKCFVSVNANQKLVLKRLCEFITKYVEN